LPELNAAYGPARTRGTGIAARLAAACGRRLAAALLILAAALPILAVAARDASAEDKTLKLYFAHTGEKAEITFKRNGRFDPRGLAQLNQFLRDWRKNEATKMDPRLFDLVWEVYRRSGATGPIYVVSGYRSPGTNNFLRTRSAYTGVAEKSQHMLGKAMDFFIPGVKLATLRGIAMQMQIGGVGFYPTSGSPFVHLDVGRVRAWPRMNRDELVKLFPKGNTLHVPADGKPLPGYDIAMADYKRRVSDTSIEVAGTAGGSFRGDAPARKRPNLLAMLFGGGADEAEDNEEEATPVRSAPAVATARSAPAQAQPSAPPPASSPAPAAPPASVMVASVEPTKPDTINAPVPLSRPAFRSDGNPTGFANALYSSNSGRNAAQDALAMQAAAQADVETGGNGQFADLAAYAVPVPTLLPPRGMKGDAQQQVLTASANPGALPADFGAVPLPLQRPETALAPQAATVAAAHVPAPTANPRDGEHGPRDGEHWKDADGQALTPALVAALSDSVEAPRGSQAKAFAPVPAPAPVASVNQAAAPMQALAAPRPVPAQRPMELAALPPKAAQAGVQGAARGNGQFGDAFDRPKLASTAAASPAKGGRGGRVSSEGAHAGVTAGASAGALTGDMLAKWALNTNRAGASASIKAPRVVSRSLDGEYSAAYAGNGFKPVAAAVAIDPNRFSGPGQ
jgi:uncharacterized protein YcbK (DUF882 family)